MERLNIKFSNRGAMMFIETVEPNSCKVIKTVVVSMPNRRKLVETLLKKWDCFSFHMNVTKRVFNSVAKQFETAGYSFEIEYMEDLYGQNDWSIKGFATM